MSIIPVFLGAFFPAIITYAIVRHRLWDIRTVVHRTGAWLLAISTLLLPIYGITLALSTWLPPLDPLQQATLLLVLSVLCALYLRAVKPRIDHWFERRALDWQRLLDSFSSAMVTLHTADHVAAQALRTAHEGLYPEHSALFIRLEEGFSTVTLPERLSRPPDPSDRFLATAAALGGAFESSQIEADSRLREVRAEAHAYFQTRGVEVTLPLVAPAGMVGVLELGPKKNMKPYTMGDLLFLERLGREAAIGLANALLFDRVDAQRRNLAKLAADLERRVAARAAELPGTATGANLPVRP